MNQKYPPERCASLVFYLYFCHVVVVLSMRLLLFFLAPLNEAYFSTRQHTEELFVPQDVMKKISIQVVRILVHG